MGDCLGLGCDCMLTGLGSIRIGRFSRMLGTKFLESPVVMFNPCLVQHKP